jgi:hypothetical protein
VHPAALGWAVVICTLRPMPFRGHDEERLPKELRYLASVLDTWGDDGSGRVLVEVLARAQVWEPYFQVVRWRERRGVYALEHDDVYVLAMINALGGGMDAEVLNAALREDQELRDNTFWRIFEVPGPKRVNLAYLDRYRGEAGEGWAASIETLVDEGTLPRDRVLEACEAATRREFPAFQRAWFKRLARRLGAGGTS